ncbi:50S ribosomal protein L3 N(5)-glutamine methyltransferase, partial [Francisella tularensis subsp. holarctica]|nr:50S ribosomal protein L3 N(5)-glutamine methyltransferase [Francisella tularensis subsp. holarctica]
GNRQYALMALCPAIPFTWLSVSEGCDGVILLTYDELFKYKDAFKKYLQK